MDPNKLKLMADLICANCVTPDHARHVQSVAEHLRMFWAPRMIDQLASASRDGSVVLDAPLVEALTQLSPPG